MRLIAFALALCGVLLQPPAAAEALPDPLSWLGRIATAGQRLNYQGTFTYQSGGHSETSRIVHRAEGGVEFERIEVLDGSPREVIRSGDEVRCVLPEQQTVIIDQPGSRRAFPSRLPAALTGLGESYRVRQGESARIAGHDTLAVVLEPRDGLRHGHVLWADVHSGLLLKSRMVDAQGHTIEQFMFNEVSIGGEIEHKLLKPRFSPRPEWRTINAQGRELSRAHLGWTLNTALPGYTLLSVMRRQIGREQGDVVHLVYGDGLATISVFIEPSSTASAPAAQASGAINIYKRAYKGHLITALGEVPLQALQRLADGIEQAGS